MVFSTSWCVLSLAVCLSAASADGESSNQTQRSILGLAKVRYDLWHGDQPSLLNRRSLHLLVRDGTPFYDVMLLAANISRSYRFEMEVVLGAQYVNSIGGRVENVEEKNLWMLYKLQSTPNPSKPPPDELLTTKGINGVFVSDGDIYLFWFKHVSWASNAGNI